MVAVFFNYNPPYFDEVSRYAFRHRQKNFARYKEIFEFWSKKHIINAKRYDEKSIYIKNYAQFSKMVRGDIGTSIRANSNFLIDEKVQEDLIKKVKKTPIFSGYTTKSNNNFEYLQRYLIGFYDEKPVLFSEVIKRPRSIGPVVSNQRTSYQLNVVLNGDINENRLLYRMDYGPVSNHTNKLGNFSVLPEKFFSKENMKKKTYEVFKKELENVFSFHIHKPTTKYNVIFPNFLHSADADNYSLTFKNYDDMMSFNTNLSKVNNADCLISDVQRNEFLNIKNLKDITVFDYTLKKEEE